MKKLQELRQQRKDLQAEGRGILSAAKVTDGGGLDETQDARLTAIDSELGTLASEIEVAELAADRVRSYAALEVPDGARIEVNDLNPETTNGFANIAEFALAVRSAVPGSAGGMIDERLLPGRGAAPTNYHQEGGSSGEGYMVPTQFRDEVFELAFTDDDVMGMVDAEPTTSNNVGLSKDESTPWGSSGVQANWRNEASQMTASKLDTEAQQVKLHELYAFVAASDELLEDAPRLNARLTRKAAQAISWKGSEAIVNGSGAGQPLGWMNSPGLVTVAKESAQTAVTLVAENVAKMYSRLMAGSHQRAIWLMNSDVLPQLMTMTLGNQPIWTPPSAGFTAAPGGFLFGRPIQFNTHSETLGTKGDIALVDPLGYYLPHKAGGVKFASSMHLYFDYNLTAFRWTFRLGGQPYLSSAIAPAKGSYTQSHFVVLATRA